MEPGDAQLVRSVLEGDCAAYAVLYERYARWVRAVCYDTTRDFSEAQDLTQEVFLRAYAQLGELRDPQRFGWWLHAIARNRCLEWLRGRWRDHCEPLPLDLIVAAEKAVDGDRDEGIVQLREALLTLPEQERLAIHVHYLLGEPVEQARSMLNLSRAGWYRLLSRARKRLERLMKRQLEDTR